MKDKIKKVDLIMPNKSQYEVLHHFTQKLHEAWLRAGYQSRLFETPAEAWDVALVDPPDLFVCFNGIPNKGDHYLTEDIKKPLLSLLVDPFYRFTSIAEDPYTIVGCDDFHGVTMLKGLGHLSLFIPHAVESDIPFNPSTPKIYDVTLLATFIDYDSRRRNWKTRYPEAICKIMDQTIEMSFNNYGPTYIDTCINLLKVYCLENPDAESTLDVAKILIDIELYIKGRERIEILKAIQTSPVHVFGNSVDNLNWKSYFSNQNNIIIHESVSYEEGLKIMNQSKIVLNSSLKNKYGAHERIFTSLAVGALALTSENPYLKSYFTHDVDIAYFKIDNLNSINQIIHSYLSDEEKREFVVDNGRQVVMKHHTWDARIQQLEKLLPSMIDNIYSKLQIV